MKKKIFLITILLIFCLGLYVIKPAKAVPSPESLKGKILLQVEQNGEAWYINPKDSRRYYLKDGIQFFNIVNDLGVGITNNDINKIPIGLEFVNYYAASDVDKDGLPDLLESAIGTSLNKADTDDDGYNDITEISTEHSPFFHKEKFDEKIIDKELVRYTKGKILIQVEKRGEAWYVNPQNGKRYYLSSPKVAYEIMKALGIGAESTVIEAIDEGLIKKQRVKRVIDGDTIELENGKIVRYIGIDAPEVSYDDCFGQKATKMNKELVEGKMIELVQDVSVRDKEGRYLAYIYVNGNFVNEYMVKNGYAFALSYAPDVKYSSLFSEHQRTAKYNRWGLWGECFK